MKRKMIYVVLQIVAFTFQILHLAGIISFSILKKVYHFTRERIPGYYKTLLHWNEKSRRQIRNTDRKNENRKIVDNEPKLLHLTVDNKEIISKL